MNDAYGDPRNYDPNAPEEFDYNAYSPVWGGPVAAPPAAEPPAPHFPPGFAQPVPSEPPAPGHIWQRDPETGEWRQVPAVPGTNNVPYTPPGPTKGPTADHYPDTGGGGTGGGGGGVGGGGSTGQFDYGRPMTNQFTPYQPLSYSPFDYEAFTPSNRDMLYDDQYNPGFQRSQERLRKMIEAGAAYQGVLRSGNTFDRLGSVLANNEESAFRAFDDRRARDYGLNRANKFGAWEANLGIAERENQRSNDFRFSTEKATADDILSRWQQLVQSATALARPV